MTRGVFRVFCLLVLCALLFASGGAQAQTITGEWDAPEPVERRSLHERRPVTSEDVPHSRAPLALDSAGGPDDYGYTWIDGGAYTWIDATGGVDTGMSGDTWGQATGPIPLPFTFEYYQNTYSQVYIAASGYVGFNNTWWDGQGELLMPYEPNNIIAPYWSLFELNGSGSAGRVFYTSGGAAPNRYFVVEWYRAPDGFDGEYTFELILYENGNFAFQYGQMNYGNGYYCATAGMEDANGFDGLIYMDFCNQMADNRAVVFTRPAPMARVYVDPAVQGSFTQAGETESFTFDVINTGDLGADTYDVTASSTWPAVLYRSDGVTPLSDTDGDGVMDTGAVAQGGEASIVARIETPAGAVIADNNLLFITATSSLNISKSKHAWLQTALPAAFAQIFADESDTPEFLLAQPAGVFSGQSSSSTRAGSDMAIAAAPNGNFIHAWSDWRCIGNPCTVWVQEINYAILDHAGAVIRPADKIADHSAATMDTYDALVDVAVTPDGRIGISWRRHVVSASDDYNDNVYFAALNPSGETVPKLVENGIKNADFW
jgi:hypothetical protein